MYMCQRDTFMYMIALAEYCVPAVWYSENICELCQMIETAPPFRQRRNLFISVVTQPYYQYLRSLQITAWGRHKSMNYRWIFSLAIFLKTTSTRCVHNFRIIFPEYATTLSNFESIEVTLLSKGQYLNIEHWTIEWFNRFEFFPYLRTNNPIIFCKMCGTVNWSHNWPEYYTIIALAAIKTKAYSKNIENSCSFYPNSKFSNFGSYEKPHFLCMGFEFSF